MIIGPNMTSELICGCTHARKKGLIQTSFDANAAHVEKPSNTAIESASKAIPLEVQTQIRDRVEVFNKKKFKKKAQYHAVMKGKFIYLMHGDDPTDLDSICRLTYQGDLENMDFAIFKYSTDKFDPNEYGFPGAERVDGTLEGAMMAGYHAYLK